MFIRHETIEKNAILMLVLTLFTVSIGGLVQIIPLFTIESTLVYFRKSELHSRRCLIKAFQRRTREHPFNTP